MTVSRTISLRKSSTRDNSKQVWSDKTFVAISDAIALNSRTVPWLHSLVIAGIGIVGGITEEANPKRYGLVHSRETWILPAKWPWRSCCVVWRHMLSQCNINQRAKYLNVKGLINLFTRSQSLETNRGSAQCVICFWIHNEHEELLWWISTWVTPSNTREYNTWLLKRYWWKSGVKAMSKILYAWKTAFIPDASFCPEGSESFWFIYRKDSQ